MSRTLAPPSRGALVLVALSACAAAPPPPPPPAAEASTSTTPAASSPPPTVAARSAEPVTAPTGAAKVEDAKVDDAKRPKPPPASSAKPRRDTEEWLIAMCRGQVSVFTEREQRLLDLVANDPDLAEAGEALRAKRNLDARQACDKLRADGKL